MGAIKSNPHPTKNALASITGDRMEESSSKEPRPIGKVKPPACECPWGPRSTGTSHRSPPTSPEKTHGESQMQPSSALFFPWSLQELPEKPVRFSLRCQAVFQPGVLAVGHPCGTLVPTLGTAGMCGLMPAFGEQRLRAWGAPSWGFMRREPLLSTVSQVA